MKKHVEKRDMHQVEKKSIAGATTVMENAVKLHKNGHKIKATQMLQKGLDTLSANIKGKPKKDVPTEMYKMQNNMATLLGKWQAELHTHEIVRAEKSKSQTRHSLDTKAKVRTVVGDLMKVMSEHKDNKEVKPLIEVLSEMSKTFMKDGDLKKYKNGCMNAMLEHKTKHHKLHHRQPSGVFQHMINAFRAMFRLIEKLINRVFGTNASMFKKPDSDLGKAVKEFTCKLKDLKEFEEPEQKVQHKMK